MAQEDLADLDGLIRGHLNAIRVIRSDLADPERVRREIQQRRDTIALLQRQIADMERRLEDGPAAIEQHQQQIKSMRTRRAYEANARDIAKLLDLAARIGELEGSV